MLNRRLIRIKVFQVLFGTNSEEGRSLPSLQKTARKSILELESHFLAVLAFIPELRQYVLTEKNPEDNKFKTTGEDMLIYRTFVDNPFAEALEEVEGMRSYMAKPSLRWADEKDFQFLIYKEIRRSEKFHELMQIMDAGQRSLELANFIYKYLILESVDFEHLMEDHILLWYDEKIPILKNVERVLKGFEDDTKIELPALSRNLEEDLEFADELLAQFLQHSELLTTTLDEHTPGWESERIMKIDYILMCMALCEFRFMPFVPVKVTMNEYIEIAKMYSTPKSSRFINGTLDKILKKWQENGEINKQGRGLIG